MPRSHQNRDISDGAVARRLTALRLERGLTKAELADAAGVTYRTVHDLEIGKRGRVQEKTLIVLAEALGIPVEEFLEGPPPATHEPPPASAQEPPTPAAHGSPSPATHEPPTPAPPATPTHSAPALPNRRRRLLAITALVAVLVVLAVQAFQYRPEVIGTTHDTTIRGEVLGLEVWSHTFEASIQFAEPSPWSEDLHLVGLTSFASDGGRLLAIDRRTGAIRWEVTPDLDEVRAAFADTVLQGGYWHAEQGGPADFDGDGTPEYVLPFTHRTWYPSVLLLVDERGTILRHYEHGGHVTGVVGADIDGDGADEVFATVMVNSSAHKGAGVLPFRRRRHARRRALRDRATVTRRNR